MVGFTRRFSVRQALIAAFAQRLLASGTQNTQVTPFPPLGPQDENVRLPNGKSQRDEILRAEYNLNLKDARDLIELTRTFEVDLEKSDRYVLSLGLLKKLDDIERITKRIRGRMRK